MVAGPGAEYSTSATPIAAVPAGGHLSFLNNDLPEHDVTAVDQDGHGRPLFHSKLIGIGEVAAVDGVERLQPGSYGFYCSIHPGMRGTLIVG